MNKPISYWNFIKRRFSKVYIPYVITIVITALVSFAIPIFDNSLYAFGGHLLLYRMFDETIVGSYGYPLWFVSMIFQFYLVFHILVYLIKKNVNIFFGVSLIISVLWSFIVICVGKESERIWNSFFLQYLWEFALGMLLAHYANYIRNKETIFKINIFILLTIGIICCSIYGGLAIKGGNIGKMLNDIPALIGYSCIAIAIYKVNIEWIRNFFIFSGQLSFPIYLLHTLVLSITTLVFKWINLYVVVLVSLLLCYALAIYYQKAISFLYGLLKV